MADIKDNAVQRVEIVTHNGRAIQQHYEPKTDEEKTLERRVNLKLDMTVVLILAIGFIVSDFQHYHLQVYAQLTQATALWHRQDEYRICGHKQFPQGCESPEK